MHLSVVHWQSHCNDHDVIRNPDVTSFAALNTTRMFLVRVYDYLALPGTCDSTISNDLPFIDHQLSGCIPHGI